MLTTYASFRMISADIGKSISRTSAQPMIKREVDNYLKQIGNIKTVDDFVKNDRVFRFAMKAYGLEDMSYAKAFIKKLLAEGVESPSSMANRLSDQRYKEFAKAFNFARYGELATTFASTRKDAVDRYLRQTLEEDAGAQNEGVRLALYFQRKAPGIKSVYGLMADPALLKVTQTLVGIPTGQATDVDATAKMIERKINIADLQKPEKVQKLLQRFAATWDANNNITRTPIESLFTGASTGMSIDMLFSLQNLKR
ncbi:MAG: DUF1217 domain-containing protein [Beijerinckiaceae bacterium]